VQPTETLAIETPISQDPYEAFELSFLRATSTAELVALAQALDPAIAQDWIVRATAGLPPDSPAMVVAAAHALVAVWDSPEGDVLASDAQVDMLRTSSGHVQHLYASALLLHRHYHQAELPYLGDDLEGVYYRAADASAQSHIMRGMALVPEYWEQNCRVLNDWFSGGYIDEARMGSGLHAIKSVLSVAPASNATPQVPDRAARVAAMSDILVRFATRPERSKEELESVIGLLRGFDSGDALERVYVGLPPHHHHLRPNLRKVIDKAVSLRQSSSAAQGN
jgi:hypothetical protein